MNKYINLDSKDGKTTLRHSNAGEFLYLSGRMLSARDSVHSKLKQFNDKIKLDKNITSKHRELLDILNESVIYYMGPSPTRDGFPIGSCGPTSSYRMDSFLEFTGQMGVIATIGKGDRANFINPIITRYKMPYLITIGGAAAYLASCVIKSRVIGFDELGAEAFRELIVKEFPVIVALDIYGNSVFNKE